MALFPDISVRELQRIKLNAAIGGFVSWHRVTVKSRAIPGIRSSSQARLPLRFFEVHFSFTWSPQALQHKEKYAWENGQSGYGY